MNPQSELSIKKSESWKMFNEISGRYDFLNHFLSMGLDIHWRNCLGKYLYLNGQVSVLDIATGTADVLLSFCKKYPQIIKAYGVDMAQQMLEVGKEKIRKNSLDNKIQLQHGDANHLPFEKESFDNATIAFGIRNMENPVAVLKGMHRVLKNDRYVLVLEFSLPQNPVLRCLHVGYLRYIVPSIGWIFSGHYRAYKYLNKTIESFPYGEGFAQLMREAGFKKVEIFLLMCGIATIYRGTKS